MMVKLLEKLVINLDVFYKKQGIPILQIGDSVKVTVYLELPKNGEESKKKEKERIQCYEGVIISKHCNSNRINSTITVRKMFQGGGIEKVFILNSPWIKTIEVISQSKVKRAKLYYLRERTGKSARLKTKVPTEIFKMTVV
jgi:large subunit ribosomal protein L19